MKTITIEAARRVGFRLRGRTLTGAASVGLGAVLLLCLTGSQAAKAQGTIYFDNDLPTVLISHVYAPLASDFYLSRIGNGPGDYPPGITSWAGFDPIGFNTNGPYGPGNTFAQLLTAPGYNQPESSLVPQTPITTFRAGGGYGYVAPVWVTPNNVASDGPATVEMVAWDNSSGHYPSWTSASLAWVQGAIAAGKSGELNLTLGVVMGMPTFLTNLPSFNLYRVPEPSMFALAPLGLAALLGFPQRKQGR
jgi:hypothetical protein